MTATPMEIRFRSLSETRAEDLRAKINLLRACLAEAPPPHAVPHHAYVRWHRAALAALEATR